MLILHNLDGEQIRLERAQVDFVRPAIVGGRVCTRIRLTSGKDLVVSEPVPEVVKRCERIELGIEVARFSAENDPAHSDSGASSGAPVPSRQRYRTHRTLYRPPSNSRSDRSDWLRAAVIVLMLVPASLMLIAYSQKGVSAGTSRVVHEAPGQDAKQSAGRLRGSSLQCESQARARFVEMVVQPGNSGTYNTHYDSNLDRCYVLVTSNSSSANGMLISMTMLEAFAGDDFAYYAARTGRDKPNSMVAPIVCEVTSIKTGQTQYCGSSEEFQSLLKPYMQ